MILGIEMSYSDGDVRRYGGCHYNHVDQFFLTKDERIVKVKANVGDMIDSLTFYTNKGHTFGPYGGIGGGPLPSDGPPSHGQSGYLVGVSGISVKNRGDLALKELSFRWAYYDLHTL